jgi:hypothetical protein
MTTLRTHFYQTYNVRLADLAATPGDMIFTRGTTSFGKLATAIFASWTHVAIIWNRQTNEVLESMPDGGVQINHIENSWKSVISYGTKSVREDMLGYYYSVREDGNGQVIDYEGSPTAHNAAKAAYRRRGVSYFGRYGKGNSKSEMVRLWSSPSDTSSMYCSKLVWNAYKDANRNIDLDSNGTKCWISRWADWSGAWIGVSPDDIWDSSQTTDAWDLQSPENLYTDLNEFPGL